MSFRLRVITMVILIAVVSTAATAWLTLQQASRQLNETVTANQQQIKQITTELGDHARTRGSWDGISTKVLDLSRSTRQRIRLTTDSGSVIADSDVLAGNTARDTTGSPLLVDPRPTWQMKVGRDWYWGSIAKTMATEIIEYQIGLVYARCLTAAGASVKTTVGEFGTPTYQAVDASEQTLTACNKEQKARSRGIRPSPQFMDAVRKCRESNDDPEPCLQSVFTKAIGAFAPAPVQVHIGAAQDPAPRLKSGTIATVAGLVAAIAIAVSWLLSRRVLRPIEALTAAARHIGQGDLARRVPAAGRDELAELARAFNRMADSLHASEERQRRMTADIAHELRTPLANLRGYLEALQDGVIPPTPEVFRSLLDEAVLQQRIIDDLQDLALAEAGALTYHKTLLDLAELLANCRDAQRVAAAHAAVNLTTVTDGPARVYGDPDRLRQVIGNLVRNALAATPAGGTITLAVTTAGDQCRVTVTDTGTGIAEADLPHLFDRFWRADPARTRLAGPSSGSGLGLAIARQFITDHGGTINAASQLGAGTTFTINLPYV
ncbi:ATP-binding protein [Catellatospora sp. NPDC049133]|uniref:sensor histidine kinase n=1 Tax=Catellatospora sp. NPDC049133 TaxID=3155499 RepID=UPI0033D279C8